MLDSGAEGPRFKSQSRRYRVTVLGKLFTPIVPLFTKQNKKLSYRRGTARCVVSVEICQFQRNSAETTYSTSPDQIDGMKLEI